MQEKEALGPYNMEICSLLNKLDCGRPLVSPVYFLWERLPFKFEVDTSGRTATASDLDLGSKRLKSGFTALDQDRWP